jgi:hypothetical protein
MERDMAVQQSFSQSDFDPGSIVKLYADAFESWKKNYESFTKAMPERSSFSPSHELMDEKPAAELQNLGSQLFRKAVETEMELCRFYEKRWSQYLKLAEAVANCKSPVELVQLQNNFCTQCAADYANEGSKLFGSFNQWASHAVAKVR